jgi:succinoglycan biosynthesis protein ExoM
MHICVCICTYKRPRLLGALLLELGRQETAGEFTYSIVVADNDADQSAKQIAGEFAAGSPVRIEYCVEPRQNIALARNKAVVNSSGDYLAFIDDDELPASDWLLTASRACIKHGVEGVLAPVRPRFEHQPPTWLVRGGFCERPEHPTGYRVGWREARTGNVLLRRSIFDGMPEPFRPEFGSGGEDTEFFKRLIERGATFLWCNEAVVYEVVPPERCTRSYLLQRAWQRGQSAKKLTTVGGVCKSLVAAPVYAFMLPFLLLAGHHWFMHYLIRICDHAGKLCAIAGYEPLRDKYVTGG